jgi:hypothetical protein
MYDIFVQKHSWTNNILKVAAAPGAWIADALRACIISIFKPGQENEQHCAGNDAYCKLYDVINEELLNQE